MLMSLALFFRETMLQKLKSNGNRGFTNICEWFVDSRLHFGEDKAKSILLAFKRKIKEVPKLKINYKNIQTFKGCILDKTMSAESMALKVINRINLRHKFPYRKKQIFNFCATQVIV